MSPAAKCRRLAEAILVFFEEGLCIDNNVQHYIDACLPGMSMEELARRFNASPDLDTASLMELVFSPDEAFQVRLEPLLEVECYDPNDASVVVKLLESHSVHTTLKWPGFPDTIPVQVPPSALEDFTRRLGISKRIPPGLANAIAGVFGRETAIRLRVRLRNAPFSVTGSAAAFLESLILGWDPVDNTIDVIFETALGLLGECRDEADPIRRLRLKTDAMYSAKDAALQFEKQLRHNNMETLMQLGIRAPGISIGEAEEKIILLDRIGRAVAIGGTKAGCGK